MSQSFKCLFRIFRKRTIQEFISDIESSYLWADIVICRSGALTVSEIIASRSVGIFVPIKASIDDHQKENANYLKSLNASGF